MTIQEVSSILKSGCKVSIVTHFNPDGDAMGSSLGLGNLLKKLNCDVCVIAPSEYPTFLKWMENTSSVLVWGTDNEQIIANLNASELVFCLDFNALHRIDQMEVLLRENQAKKIMIDHHIEPENFAALTISDTSKSSTSEMVYDFISACGFNNLVDKSVAEPLYCGIMTDTGSFRYPSTSSHTHRIAAELIDAGADKNKIHQLVYDSNTPNRLHLLGHCLNNFEILIDKVALFSLSIADHDRLNVQKGDTEGIVNFGLSIQTVQMSAFFKEDVDKIKISFRSKGDLDVNQFARKYFNGGGHKNAAGGSCKSTLQEAIAKFKNDIRDL